MPSAPSEAGPKRCSTKWTRGSPGYGQANGGHMGHNGNTAQWFAFIRGRNPNYPEEVLEANLGMIARQIAAFRSDANDPLTIDHYAESMTIHKWQQITPLVIEGLAQLTLGGPMHVYHGGLNHARFRYFDVALVSGQACPSGVAALVEALAADSALGEPRQYRPA